MKTSVLKSIALFIILNFFNYSIIANGLSFSIEVQKTDKNLDVANYPVKIQKDKILIGNFEDYLVAMKAKLEIQKEFSIAGEIKAFFNAKPISLDDAFVLLDNRNSQDENLVHSLTEEDMDKMLKNVNHPFFYTIQMGVYSEKNVESFYNFPKSVDERITPKGHFRYTFGEFKTLQDAKDALRMVKENGMDNAIIIAHDNIDRIPLARAIEKEKQMLNEALAYTK